MFWGLVLKSNKRYSQVVSKSFHLSQAVLDVASCGDDPVQVVLTTDKSNFILCTLRKNHVEQVSLDLNFGEGDDIAFTSQGGGNVHLSGYLIENPEDVLLDDMEEEEEEVEAETKPNKKRGKGELAKNNAEEDDEDSDMEEDSDEESEDEDENEEEDDESDSEVEEPKLKQRKVEKKSKQQNGLDTVKPQNALKAQKNKEKDSFKNEKSQKEGGEKTLQGGVKIEDIRVGNGPEAKAGKKVQVYYEGRLKSNNKVFDSSKNGPGFKFHLGRGDVISGWDIGVVGMKVGGKRRITCPPKFAYGAKGSPPVIPPNSTLVFEVELKGVQ